MFIFSLNKFNHSVMHIFIRVGFFCRKNVWCVIWYFYLALCGYFTTKARPVYNDLITTINIKCNLKKKPHVTRNSIWQTGHRLRVWRECVYCKKKIKIVKKIINIPPGIVLFPNCENLAIKNNSRWNQWYRHKKKTLWKFKRFHIRKTNQFVIEVL